MLNRLNLSVKTGEKIALVGESGCGKSTVIQLIQRLYDLDNGCLDLQGNNIQALNLPYVRCWFQASDKSHLIVSLTGRSWASYLRSQCSLTGRSRRTSCTGTTRDR